MAKITPTGKVGGTRAEGRIGEQVGVKPKSRTTTTSYVQESGQQTYSPEQQKNMSELQKAIKRAEETTKNAKEHYERNPSEGSKRQLESAKGELSTFKSTLTLAKQGYNVGVDYANKKFGGQQLALERASRSAGQEAKASRQKQEIIKEFGSIAKYKKAIAKEKALQKQEEFTYTSPSGEKFSVAPEEGKKIVAEKGGTYQYGGKKYSYDKPPSYFTSDPILGTQYVDIMKPGGLQAAAKVSSVKATTKSPTPSKAKDMWGSLFDTVRGYDATKGTGKYTPYGIVEGIGSKKIAEGFSSLEKPTQEKIIWASEFAVLVPSTAKQYLGGIFSSQFSPEQWAATKPDWDLSMTEPSPKTWGEYEETSFPSKGELLKEKSKGITWNQLGTYFDPRFQYGVAKYNLELKKGQKEQFLAIGKVEKSKEKLFATGISKEEFELGELTSELTPTQTAAVEEFNINVERYSELDSTRNLLEATSLKKEIAGTSYSSTKKFTLGAISAGAEILPYAVPPARVVLGIGNIAEGSTSIIYSPTTMGRVGGYVQVGIGGLLTYQGAGAIQKMFDTSVSGREAFGLTSKSKIGTFFKASKFSKLVKPSLYAGTGLAFGAGNTYSTYRETGDWATSLGAGAGTAVGVFSIPYVEKGLSNYLKTGRAMGYSKQDIKAFDKLLKKENVFKAEVIKGKLSKTGKITASGKDILGKKFSSQRGATYKITLDKNLLSTKELAVAKKFNLRGTSFQQLSRTGKNVQGLEFTRIKTGGLFGKELTTYSSIKGVQKGSTIMGTRTSITPYSDMNRVSFELFKATGKSKDMGLFKFETSKGSNILFAEATSGKHTLKDIKWKRTPFSGKSVAVQKLSKIQINQVVKDAPINWYKTEVKGVETFKLPSSGKQYTTDVTLNYKTLSGAGRGGQYSAINPIRFSRRGGGMKPFLPDTSSVSVGGGSTTSKLINKLVTETSQITAPVPSVATSPLLTSSFSSGTSGIIVAPTFPVTRGKIFSSVKVRDIVTPTTRQGSLVIQIPISKSKTRQLTKLATRQIVVPKEAQLLSQKSSPALKTIQLQETLKGLTVTGPSPVGRGFTGLGRPFIFPVFKKTYRPRKRKKKSKKGRGFKVIRQPSLVALGENIFAPSAAKGEFSGINIRPIIISKPKKKRKKK